MFAELTLDLLVLNLLKLVLLSETEPSLTTEVASRRQIRVGDLPLLTFADQHRLLQRPWISLPEFELFLENFHCVLLSLSWE